jgi:hypothetical protein
MCSERRDVQAIKEAHRAEIMGRPNVVGVGVGYKVVQGAPTVELSIVALVQQKVPEAALARAALVPSAIEGVPTDVVPVGALWIHQARTDRWRPAPGGVSLGHYLVSAGTFGAVVRDGTSGDRLILSNNHVLANSNDASPGDPILQPGAVDGGSVDQDTIAHLERFCPISYSSEPGTCGTANAYALVGNALARLAGSRHRLRVLQVNPEAANRVDAAVARPVSDGDVWDEILEIGEVSGTVEAELGMAVRKSGRTTGFTTGTITILHTTVEVNYGEGRVAQFEDQIISTAMSQGGDSGSLLVAVDSQQAVGLLFAGSQQVTIYNPIQAVLDCLDVTI